MKNLNISDVQSVLKMNNLYMKHFNFQREPIINSAGEIKYQFGKNISEINDNVYNVSLSIKVCHDNFQVELTVVGEFETEGFEENEVLIYKNSLAILFPYLRSQLTILSAQPNMAPIILPPLNINLLFEQTQE